MFVILSEVKDLLVSHQQQIPRFARDDRHSSATSAYSAPSAVKNSLIFEGAYGLEIMTVCLPPSEPPTPANTAPAEPGSIGAPVKAAVPDRIDARYRGSR